jgi:hypothetical protein
MTDSTFTLVLCLVFLIGCPSSKPSKDDTAEPAGDTGAACEDEQAKIRVLEAELAECKAPK